MALTVEELQIVLSCDATTAQTVLKQMSATVKAYTDKFQSYFDKMGSGKGPKNLASDVKAIGKSIGPVKKALGDIQRNEYKVGKVLTTEQMAAQIAKNCAKATEETRNYFANSQAEYQRTVDKIADDNQLIGLGAKMRGMMEEATGSIEKMPDVLKYQVQQTAQSIKTLSSEYAKSIAQSGENSKGSLSIKKKLEAAVVAADKLLQKMRKIAAEQNAEPSQKAVTPPPEAPSRWERVSASISAARKRAHTFGVAVKKAFNHTLLGRFLNRLRMVTMRMAAMALIRGVINGTKQGLQELAKTSESSAKAMNTVKAAGGSIKMALGAALMPIVKALAPVFVSLAGAISSAANALARFFAVVTGQSTYTAVNFSGALDGITSSAGGAGKAVHGMLAEFDELIVIGNNAGGGGGGGSGVKQSLSTTSDLLAVSELGTKIREAIERGDWRGVGVAIGEKVNESISGWDAAGSAVFISDKIKNGLDIALGLIETTDFTVLGEKLVEFFTNIDYSGIADRISEGIGAAIGSLGEFLWGIIKGALKGAFADENGKISLGSIIDGIIDIVTFDPKQWALDHIVVPFFDGVVNAVTDKSSGDSPIKGFIDRIREDLSFIVTIISAAISAADDIVNTFLSSIFDIVSASLGIAGEYVGAFFETLIDFIAARGEIISGNVQRFVLNIKASVLEGLAGLVDNLSNGPMGRLLNLIGVDLAGAAETLRGKAAEARDSIGEIDTKIQDAQTRAANGFDISANVNASKVDALKTKIDNAKSAIGGTSSKVGELNGKLDELNGKNVNTTVTVKVNTKGGTSSSSGSVTVSRPNVNITLAHLAVGGIAYGPAAALIGEYAGAAHNPEVVAPLSDLVGILSEVGSPNNGPSDEEMRLLREQNNLLRQIAQKELKLSPSTQLGQVVERSRQLYART